MAISLKNSSPKSQADLQHENDGLHMCMNVEHNYKAHDLYIYKNM